MKKGEMWFFAHMQSGDAPFQWTRFKNRGNLVSHLNESEVTISKIVSVQITGEWEIEQVALLVPKVEDEKPNNIGENPNMGSRENDGNKLCLDIRCIDGDDHYRKDCPYKDESTPCEDDDCQVMGPHTVYNCKNVPRKKKIKWKDIDTTPRMCTNDKCGMVATFREEKCMRSTCPKYE